MHPSDDELLAHSLSPDGTLRDLRLYAKVMGNGQWLMGDGQWLMGDLGCRPFLFPAVSVNISADDGV